MRRATIFLNGNPPKPHEYSGALGFTVCADGAYSYLEITPDLVIGDFDSLSGEIEEGIEVKRFPPEKDYTDGHLAMAECLSRGYTDIVVFGAFGGRPDLFYANLFLLEQARKGGAQASLVGDGYTVTLERGKIKRKAKKGATVSLAPFYSSAHIISTKGLKYPAHDVTLDRTHALGVSNVAESEEIEIEVEGELLVFIQNI